MENNEAQKGITVAISGEDPTAIGLAASAVNFGLVECGFENVSIAVPEGVICHQADENLMAIMRQAKERNPEPFQTEADIIILVGEDDEPEEGDTPPERLEEDDQTD